MCSPPKTLPWSRIEGPRPADWAIGMTLCIAVVADDDRTLIAASDCLVATEHFAADNLAVKQRAIHRCWRVSIAGNDLGCVDAIIDRAMGLLGGIDGPETTVAVVQDAVRTAYHEQVTQRATD